MSGFVFRLATLLRLREAARDERRRELAAAQEADAKLARRLDQIAADQRLLNARQMSQHGPGAVNVDRLLDLQRYAALLEIERQAVAGQRDRLAAEIDRRREALVAADREVKTLENHREQLRAEHRAADERRELAVLDEVGTQRHWAREDEPWDR